jgi:hypothetical protein
VKRPALRTGRISAPAAVTPASAAAAGRIERRCHHHLTSATAEILLTSEAANHVPSRTDYNDIYWNEPEIDDSTELDALATAPSPFVEAIINLTLQSQLEAVELKNSSEMMELAASILEVHCQRSVFNWTLISIKRVGQEECT